MTAIHKRPDGTKHLVIIFDRLPGLPGFFRCVSNENKNEHITVHRDSLTILDDQPTNEAPKPTE
jgi:hypothetical protein